MTSGSPFCSRSLGLPVVRTCRGPERMIEVAARTRVGALSDPNSATTCATLSSARAPLSRTDHPSSRVWHFRSLSAISLCVEVAPPVAIAIPASRPLGPMAETIDHRAVAEVLRAARPIAPIWTREHGHDRRDVGLYGRRDRTLDPSARARRTAATSALARVADRRPSIEPRSRSAR